MRVHYANNRPFAVLHRVVREISWSYVHMQPIFISIGIGLGLELGPGLGFNWVHVDEQYELKHTGARLVNGFSRVLHSISHSDPNPLSDSPSFSSIVAAIPAGSRQVYYRDAIGAISSTPNPGPDRNPKNSLSDHSLSLPPPQEVELELELGLRYPLYGGWHTDFNIGYTLPMTVGNGDNDGGGSDNNVSGFDNGKGNGIATGYASYYSHSHPNHKYHVHWNYSSSVSVSVSVSGSGIGIGIGSGSGTQLHVSELISRFQLPYGAFNIRTTVPYGGSETRSNRQTFISMVLGGDGHTVVEVTSSNVVVEHDRQIEISYELDMWGVWLGTALYLLSSIGVYI